MATDFKRTKEYRELKRFLTDDLTARGLVGPVYEDQVKSYLSFVEMERAAEADIAEWGLNVWDEKRQSWQQNPCVSTKTNARRMALTIYKALGYEDEAKKAKAGGGEDDAL